MPLYFYDISLREILGHIDLCSNILYHGSSSRPCGTKTPNFIDLDNCNLIQAHLRVFSELNSTHAYKYQALFVKNELYQQLWSNRPRSLKKISCRVSCTKTAQLKAPLVNVTLGAKRRPIHLAEFNAKQSTPSHAPAEYHQKLIQQFKVILVRAPKSFPVLNSLCNTIDAEVAYTNHRPADNVPQPAEKSIFDEDQLSIKSLRLALPAVK
ncbi:hypothetical protein [Persicirhabdus sediminis]|uniref:Uncharacterized protein n=1 Tax=Persicirhabdus sediminis TaxID=454144 RepID=A0A8J7SP50_9BACT|nr:hypothetical protein [Persicirhabdus sediminis]MBK1792108.1 hypothetical protein [Persicirhabdus sediminis]